MNQLVMLHNIIITLYICIMITGNKSVLGTYDVYHKMKVASLDSFFKSGVVVVVIVW